MNPDYVALGVMVLLALALLAAWWYVSRPASELERMLVSIKHDLREVMADDRAKRWR